jgi:hypothetical protein
MYLLLSLEYLEPKATLGTDYYLFGIIKKKITKGIEETERDILFKQEVVFPFIKQRINAE